MRLRGRKRLASALSQEFLQQFIAGKLQKASRGRRQASDMTRTLRVLAAAPTTQSAMNLLADADSPVSASSASTGSDPGHEPIHRVEPEILRIGTGYVGTP